MKKIIGTAMMLSVISVLLSSCYSLVPAGYRGIKVYMLGNKKGVSEKQLGVGRYWMGVNQKLYIFPVFQQNYVWDGGNAINFQSKEGLDVSGDFGISYSLIADSVPVIFQKYRRGIDEITNVFLRNMVRDALNNISSRMPIESIYGIHKRDLLTKVDSMVSKQTKKYGIIIDRIYTIGELHLPSSIESAITAKLEANQRSQQAQNEVKAVEAEANKKIVRSKADAESQVINAKADAEKKVIEAKAQSDATVFIAKASAESIQIRAKAEAESIKIKALAQADSIKAVGESKALVNKKMAMAVNKDLIQYHSLDRWDGKLPQISTQNLPFVNLGLPKQ
jgi:regulator of protease activity HflC (stomatin/prohibitin superfamily)